MISTTVAPPQFQLNQNTLASFSIQIHVTGLHIQSAVVDFMKEWQISPFLSHPLHIGKATVQIVDHSLPSSVPELIQTMKQYPKELLGKIDELRTAFEVVPFLESYQNEKIAILHQIEIFKEYRGNRLAQYFIWLLLKGLKEHYNVDYVLVQPYPYEVEQTNKPLMRQGIARLEKLYTRCGFKIIKNLPLTSSIDGSHIHYMWTRLSGRNFYQFPIKK